MDQLSLETTWNNVRAHDDQCGMILVETIKSYAARRQLGDKLGEAFYTYPSFKFTQATFLMRKCLILALA